MTQKPILTKIDQCPCGSGQEAIASWVTGGKRECPADMSHCLTGKFCLACLEKLEASWAK